MTNPTTLNITSREDWMMIVQWSDGQIETTRENLVDALVDFPDGDQIIALYHRKKLAKEMEQSERLKPVGFEYAPASAKNKRERLRDETLQWMYYNISYNSDWTMNIHELNKTFCEDVSWTGKMCNWEDAKALAASKWYTLLTDYNDCDSREEKEQSDRYNVINIFSDGNWDTTEGMKLFRDMAWCNDLYWTATPYKDGNWIKGKGVARSRKLDEHNCYRSWDDIYYNHHVCGFKPAS